MAVKRVIKTAIGLFCAVCAMMIVLLLVGIPISVIVMTTENWTDTYIQFVKDFTIGSMDFYGVVIILCFVISLLLEFVEESYR